MKSHKAIGLKLILLIILTSSCDNDKKFRKRKIKPKQQISGADTSIPKDVYDDLENLAKAQKDKIERLEKPKDPLKEPLIEKDLETISVPNLLTIMNKLYSSYQDANFDSQEYQGLPQDNKNQIRKTNARIASNYCNILKHIIKTHKTNPKLYQQQLQKDTKKKQKLINLHIAQIGPQPIETEETPDQVRNMNLNTVSEEENASSQHDQEHLRSFQQEQEEANKFIKEISPYVNIENCFDSLKLFYSYRAVARAHPLILDISDYNKINPDTIPIPDRDSLDYHANDKIGTILDYHFRKLLIDHISNKPPSSTINNRKCNIIAPKMPPLHIPQIFYSSCLDNKPSLNKYIHPTGNTICNLAHIDDMIRLSISLLDYFYKDIIMETLRSVEGNENYGSLEQRITEEEYQLTPQAFSLLKENFEKKDLDNKYYKLLLHIIEIAYIPPNEITETHQQTILKNKDQLRRLLGFYPMNEFDILELLKIINDNRL